MMVKRYSSYTARGFFLACFIIIASFFGVIAASGTSLAATPHIAAGGHHTVSLKSDGTVWAWGYNGYGQLGDGTYTDSSTPVQVYGMSGVTAIAAGDYHTVSLRSDGTVWAWGYNGYGQLGDGTYTDSSTPVQVYGMSGVTAIAAGAYHTVSLKSDGTVWAWGYKGDGELGDGTYTNSSTPVQVSSLSGATAIAAGYYHTVSLKSDGTVWAWGSNDGGQLGDGTTTQRANPVQVSGLSGVTTIAAGYWHTASLKTDGTVWAWGSNGDGELGDGTTTDRYTPVQVRGLNLGSTTITTPTPSPSAAPSPTPPSSKGKIYGYVRHTHDNVIHEEDPPTRLSILGDSRHFLMDFHPRYSASTVADDTGYYEFSDLEADTYTMTCEMQGYRTVTFIISIDEGEQEGISFELSKTQSGTGIVFGYVYDEDENPLKSVTVEIDGDDYSHSGKTDGDGYYKFEEVPAGDYIVTYTKTGYETQTQDVTVEEGDEAQLESVTMPAVQKGTIYGYVTDIKGDPIESVRLKLTRIGTKTKKSTSTDSDGFFEFTDLEAGTYRIMAKKKFYKAAQKTVVVEEGEDVEIEIEMNETRSRILPG